MSQRTRIWILGATSAIAQAYARRRAAQGSEFVLLGRRSEALGAVAADLIARGAASAEPFVTDLSTMGSINETVQSLSKSFGFPDEALVAYGVLCNQETAEADLTVARAALDTNFTSAVLWILALLSNHQRHREGVPFTLIGIGSVAGDRGRASNFIYGAAKAGLDRVLEGLSQKFNGTKVCIVTVKPGFVDTPMTTSIAKKGLLWSTPDRVAADIDRAVTNRRRVVYTPWFWRLIMAGIRHMPWFIFKHLKI
jgi:decaprenylphospho-beta-D-erythro-pentofuranosid-2-ulose 2-reductase